LRAPARAAFLFAFQTRDQTRGVLVIARRIVQTGRVSRFYFLLLVAWGACAPSIAFAQVELRGRFIDYLRVNPNGALVDPVMFRSMRYSEDGVTFSCDLYGPGSPVVATTVVATTSAGTVVRGTNSNSMNGIATITPAMLAGRTIAWSGNLVAANLRVDQVIEYETDDRIAQLHVRLTNTGTTALTNVHYFVSGDPDHGSCSIGTAFTTNNDVRLQPPAASGALATATAGTTTRLTFGIGCADSRARANNSGFGSMTAETAWTTPIDRNGGSFDEDIGVVLKEPLIPAGGVIEFTYFLIWGTTEAEVERRFDEAQGARILFVSDRETDTNIAAALAIDRHRVVSVINDYTGGDNAALLGALGGFDAVIWSATGDGSGGAHTNPAVFANLMAYVMAGGLVLVTGFDAVVDPDDPAMLAFLGAGGAANGVPDPAAVSAVRTLLNVGLFDLRGVLPAGFAADLDGLTGLGSDTVSVVDSSAGGTAQWTVRTVGSGRVAFVANGDAGPISAHGSWDTLEGAYNGAIRNFAFAAARGLPAIKPNGDNCRTGIECLTDFCIDGVCCASRCGEGNASDCQACSTAAGGLANGTCGPLSAMAATRVVCRAPAGGCDFPETCVSSSMECPADGLRTAGFECRPQIGPCDRADVCSGSSRDCPEDAVESAGMPCRDAAGDCDVAETCDGSSPACPANVFVERGTECRAADGICDAAESCDGVDGECPPDRLAGGDVECRASTAPCDAPEMCDGSARTCPADVARPDGVSCDDAMMCNGVDVCTGGACVSRGSPCDDGDACTADVCTEESGCASAPIDDCCYDSSGCDDGDPCTRDECTRDHVCVHDIAAICGDAGPAADGGLAGDGGVGADAGSRDPTDDGGCGCAAGGRDPLPLGLLVLFVFLGLAVPRRRR
jgi:MYXO-CTERM domain-containing protein